MQRQSPSESPGRCQHCGSPVPADSPRAGFCCRGCEVVHGLLLQEGLGRYYELAGTDAAPAEPPRDRSHAWLEPLVDGAETGGGDICSLSLDVQGVHCTACVWLMNELFHRREGGCAITVNPALGKMRLAWQRGRFDVREYLGEVERFGYLFGPDRKRADSASRELPIRIGLSAAITMNVMTFSLSFYLGLDQRDPSIYRLFTWLTVGLSALVVIIGGQPFFRAAWRALRRGVLHLDLPIAVGILLAFGASFVQARSGQGERTYFDTLNVFVTLMLVGRWLQQRVLEKNRRFLIEDDGIDGLQTRRRSGDRLESVPAASVRAGDMLVVAPGDLVPVDAVIGEGAGSFSTAWITGEPDVRTFAAGETVPGGAWNAGQAALTLVARTDFADSPLPALLRASSPKVDERGVPAHARFFDRYARAFVVLVLSIAAAGALLWWYIDRSRALDVTVAVLVVTCPCAVGLAAPLAVELTLARLRRVGFFVRSADLLERLPRVRKLLFDKTGTLTLGRLALVGGDAPGTLPEALRDAAFDMASRSNHPVSRCLAEALGRGGARFRSDASVVERPGDGLQLERDGHVYRLGRPAWAAPDVELPEELGLTVLSVDGRPAARFVSAEEIRPDARRELAKMQQQGLEVWLISGDAPARVSRLAAELGIPPERALGGRRPEDKAEDVARIDARDTLYLGDGVNDSLAFSRAYCAGTTAIDRPVLPGKSDFFLLGEGIYPVREALRLAHRLHSVLWRNLLIAIVYNVGAVIACLLGLMTPVRAAVAMPTSSVLLLLLTRYALSPQRDPVAAREAPVPVSEEALAWRS